MHRKRESNTVEGTAGGDSAAPEPKISQTKREAVREKKNAQYIQQCFYGQNHYRCKRKVKFIQISACVQKRERKNLMTCDWTFFGLDAWLAPLVRS